MLKCDVSFWLRAEFLNMICATFDLKGLIQLSTYLAKITNYVVKNNTKYNYSNLYFDSPFDHESSHIPEACTGNSVLVWSYVSEAQMYSRNVCVFK